MWFLLSAQGTRARARTCNQHLQQVAMFGKFSATNL
jgi:hypothetical protein